MSGDIPKLDTSKSGTGPSKPAAAANFANVTSGGASTAPAAAQAASATTTYTVQPGDTLTAIAKQHYGKASAYRRIFEANRDQLDNPDHLEPGQVLKIPAVTSDH